RVTIHFGEDVTEDIRDREEQHTSHERHRADQRQVQRGDLGRAYEIGAQQNADVGAENQIVVLVGLHGLRQRRESHQLAARAGSTVPASSPKPMRTNAGFSHQARKTTRSPSARNVRRSPPGSVMGRLPPAESSSNEPASSG